MSVEDPTRMSVEERLKRIEAELAWALSEISRLRTILQSVGAIASAAADVPCEVTS